MNIMNAKKEFKFKTHTCKIDVLGIEKEITYNNVIWISPNKLWILYANDDGIIQVDILKGLTYEEMKKSLEKN